MSGNYDKSNVVLEVKDLRVQYRASGEVVEAVNGVSFQLHEKQSLALVGETGAGKTTIAKAIMSILPDPPAKVVGGEIFFEDQDMLNMKEKQLRKIRGRKDLHDLSGPDDRAQPGIHHRQPDRRGV